MSNFCGQSYWSSWASKRRYQLISAPYQWPLYKNKWQDERQLLTVLIQLCSVYPYVSRNLGLFKHICILTQATQECSLCFADIFYHIYHTLPEKQGKSEGFDSCDRPSNLAQIWSKSSIFQSMWPWSLMDNLEKILGHIFYTTLGFEHHVKSSGEFKLKLQSGNTQFGSKLAIFVLCDLEIWWMTLENNRAPLLYFIKFVHHFKVMGEFKLEVMLNSGQNRQFFVLCDLEFWWMTLKNNRAPLLSCFKLCASFHSHQWIQIIATVQKPPIWVKIDVFVVPCDF